MTHQKLRPFECEQCQRKFSSKFALRTHERQHTQDMPFTCNICGQSFRQKVSLKGHRKTVHNIEEPLTCACEVCGKWFSKGNILNDTASILNRWVEFFDAKFNGHHIEEADNTLANRNDWNPFNPNERPPTIEKVAQAIKKLKIINHQELINLQ
ncbi:unnamed protein product [Diabrotica balteata]|uniref:C2H2-type domain-containing protein n=1 Tax=Diabrotica balteata TaxID=107213 RepID=A0A9P0DTX3_DIABA|nr:unnamed protein product [Diabrotica balteata]